MEAVILIGIQGSGKSTFYRERFAVTRQWLNLNSMKTRHQEMAAFASFLERKLNLVVDNTNTTATGRQRLRLARMAGFRVIGYFFEPVIAECLKRNESREGNARVPRAGFFGTLKRLQRPSLSEGFDELLFVEAQEGKFIVKPCEKAAESGTPVPCKDTNHLKT